MVLAMAPQRAVVPCAVTGSVLQPREAGCHGESKSRRRKLRDRRVAVRHALIRTSQLKEALNEDVRATLRPPPGLGDFSASAGATMLANSLLLSRFDKLEGTIGTLSHMIQQLIQSTSSTSPWVLEQQTCSRCSWPDGSASCIGQWETLQSYLQQPGQSWTPTLLTCRDFDACAAPFMPQDQDGSTPKGNVQSGLPCNEMPSQEMQRRYCLWSPGSKQSFIKEGTVSGHELRVQAASVLQRYVRKYICTVESAKCGDTEPVDANFAFVHVPELVVEDAEGFPELAAKFSRFLTVVKELPDEAFGAEQAYWLAKLVTDCMGYTSLALSIANGIVTSRQEFLEELAREMHMELEDERFEDNGSGDAA